MRKWDSESFALASLLLMCSPHTPSNTRLRPAELFAVTKNNFNHRAKSLTDPDRGTRSTTCPGVN